jgi:hypothetical protein
MKIKEFQESHCGLFETTIFSTNGPGKTEKSKCFSYTISDAEPPKYAVGMLTI